VISFFGMKTTVEIEDRLFERAKAEALRRKTTLRRLIEAGLRHELTRPPKAGKFRLRDASFKGGGGLMPGVDFSNWEQMHELTYGDRG
jgi:hypothetical protein